MSAWVWRLGLDRHKMAMCLHLVSLFTDPLFLFIVRRARVIKNKPRGIYWPPVQRGKGGGSCRSRAPLALAHAVVFQKNEKKNKTTSVYRLTLSTFTHTPGFYVGYLRGRSFPPQTEWYLCQISRTNYVIICLYYYPQKFCNFHM